MATDRLTRKQAAALAKYAYRLARGLGLRDWEFEIARRTLPKDAAFATNTFYGPQRFCRIAVRRDFLDYPKSSQRTTMVHEVLHCHVGGSIDGTVYDLHGLIPDPAAELVSRYHIERVEFAVDGISTAIAKHFPLPGIPKAKRK